MNTTGTSTSIVSYKPGYAEAFRQLNEAWLVKYFTIEPADEQVLGNPQAYIIDKGGHIFFIKVNDAIAGTVALQKVNDSTFELAKMAVAEKFQGMQLGNKLLAYCIEFAKGIGASKLILYSNRKLLPALHLYQKFGFKEMPVGSSIYNRADIKMEMDLK